RQCIASQVASGGSSGIEAGRDAEIGPGTAAAVDSPHSGQISAASGTRSRHTGQRIVRESVSAKAPTAGPPLGKVFRFAGANATGAGYHASWPTIATDAFA